MVSRRCLAFARIAVLGMIACVQGRPVAAADAILFRIFLLDGTTVVSYGEFSRAGGDVVFSLPLGGLDTAAPSLQLVTMPEAAVDWPKTEAYAAAARARQFADTRGEAAFEALSEQVAQTLNSVALMKDSRHRLEAAEQARRMLAEWPAQNFGYRAADVAQLSSLLDEVVSQLRVNAGLSRFDVNLVSGPVASAPEAVLEPPPTLRESVEQALGLARRTTDAVQRTTLLGAIVTALETPNADADWVPMVRAHAIAELAQARRVDAAYAALTTETLKKADARQRRADVKGVESLVRDVLERDDKLGRRRPHETSALLQTLDARLQATRRRRLALDRFAVQRRAVGAYERQARAALALLARSRSSLEQIQKLAGPSPRTLIALEDDTTQRARLFALIKPSPDVEAVHSMLTSALQMTVRAAATRTRAITGNDMNLAWQASSAAAGALLLVDRARGELERLRTPPGS